MPSILLIQNELFLSILLIKPYRPGTLYMARFDHNILDLILR